MQDVIERGIELAIAEIAAERLGRPTGRLDGWTSNSGRPDLTPENVEACERGEPVATCARASDLINDLIKDDLDKDDVDQRSLIHRRPDGQNEFSKNFLAELSSRINPESVAQWFSPLSFHANHDRQTVEIDAPSLVIRNWIVARYTKILADVLNALGLPEWSISWSLPASETQPPPTPETKRRRTAADEKERLLNLYAIVFDKQISPATLASFEKIADCAPESVEAGIMRSRLKAKKPVNSFEYCVKAIRQIESARLGPQLVDALRYELFNQPALPGTAGDLVQLQSNEETEQ